jgi:hypothetical protein
MSPIRAIAAPNSALAPCFDAPTIRGAPSRLLADAGA